MPRRKRDPGPPGKRYESIVARIHRQFAGSAQVTEDDRIRGRSGRLRQVDVAIRSDVAGHPVLVVVECKDYKRPVPMRAVEELIAKVEDVSANKGVLVSDSGFTAGALARAKESGIVDVVSVVDTENPDLRTRIGLPVKVYIFRPELPLRFSFAVDNQSVESDVGADPGSGIQGLVLKDDEHRARFLKAHLPRLKRHFKEWYNREGVRLKAGKHVFVDEPIEVDGVRLIGRCRFQNSVRAFVNQDLFAKGVGIYDHASRKIRAGGELRNIHINLEEIEDSWREVPTDFELEGCRTFFASIARYRLDESAEDEG